MSRAYHMTIHWSDEDAAYILSHPDFGPYVKTHGETIAEAMKNGGEVLEMMLDDEHAGPSDAARKRAG